MWLNRLQVATRNVTWSLNVNSTFITLCKKNACSTAMEEESAVESSEHQIRTLRAALLMVEHMYTRFVCLMKSKLYFLTKNCITFYLKIKVVTVYNFLDQIPLIWA